MIDSFGLSDAGPVRPNNEDSFLTDGELSLFVVADGMGGHAAGEVASRLAVEAIENFIRRSQTAADFSWPCGIDPALSFTSNRLRTAIHLANRRVLRVAEDHDGYTGMGTTVVCALIRGASLSIGHVGDSRLYKSCPTGCCHRRLATTHGPLPCSPVGKKAIRSAWLTIRCATS